MLVKDRMTRDPYTIQVNSSINTLIGLMREKGLRKVPVLDGEKLVGIVTDRDIERVSPSQATSLSVYEINYLLSKVTVADAMVKDPVTCTPDTFIEDAALLMRNNRINSLMVVDNGRLVGIVSDSDLFDALIDMMGGRNPGYKVILNVDNVPGILVKLGTATSECDTNITHFTMTEPAEGKALLLLKMSRGADPVKLRRAIEDAGLEIVSFITD